MKRLLLVGVLAACGGSDPVDVAGNYMIAITYRENGCMLPNWMTDQMVSGIPVTITQSGEDATANVMGLAQLALDSGLGSHAFTGKVDGDELSLAIVGTQPQQSGNCTFTYNAKLAATLAGDALSGQLEYTAATNDQSDCATLEGCKSTQAFNGTRPPR